MRYVKRDENGLVVGHFANEQPYATELVADDHPDIEAFKERRRAKQVPTAERFASTESVAALVARIEALENKLKDAKHGR
jgi:hypothetical protein